MKGGAAFGRCGNTGETGHLLRVGCVDNYSTAMQRDNEGAASIPDTCDV